MQVDAREYVYGQEGDNQDGEQVEYEDGGDWGDDSDMDDDEGNEEEEWLGWCIDTQHEDEGAPWEPDPWRDKE